MDEFSGVIRKNVEGRRIVLIDDSIVRGNTMRILVQMLLNAGAKEVDTVPKVTRAALDIDFDVFVHVQVHLRIASPPVKFPCFMGINIPTTGELLASNKNLDEITAHIGATSVAYLSVDGLRKVR